MYPDATSYQFPEACTLVAAIINYVVAYYNPKLGASIHKYLKWASHINKISNKANSALAFSQRSQRHANCDLKDISNISLVVYLEILFYSLAPHLTRLK